MAGSLLRSGMLQAPDKDGRTLSDVLYMHGFDGSDDAVGQIALRREAVKGCVCRTRCIVWRIMTGVWLGGGLALYGPTLRVLTSIAAYNMTVLVRGTGRRMQGLAWICWAVL